MKKFKKLSALIIMMIIAATSVLCFSTNAATAAGKTYKVMIINFDPTFNVNGKTLKQHELISNWNDPYKLADEFAQTMSEISYGNVNYKITKKIELNEMPRSSEINAAPYTTDEYYKKLMSAAEETDGAYWNAKGWKDYGFTFDYEYYLSKYVYDEVNKGNIDEVWFFAGPCIGVTLNETAMIGKDAFPVNNVAIHKDGMKNFIAYGFNYERGLAEMLEDAGHRQEWIMREVLGDWPNYDKDYSQYNDWEKFTAYNDVAEGKAGVGDVHHAPNSLKDYDWGNKNTVDSYCDNWYNYPDLSGAAKQVNCDTWGSPYALNHKIWWFKHLPHATGKNAKTDLYNNWWIYFSLEYLNNPPAEKYHIGTCTFSNVSKTTYLGSPATPAITVKHGSKTLKAGTDYTIAYKNNTNTGTATITVTGKGNYTATKEITFQIQPKKLTNPTISSVSDMTYTGSAIKPALTVKDGSKTLKLNTDYTLSYNNNINAGTATVTANFKGNYSGSKSVNFKIQPKTLSAPVISSVSNTTYTGSAIKPTPAVKDGSKVLNLNTDYTLAYSNNVNVGTATVKVNFKGNYTGSKNVSFKIVAKKLTAPTISSVSDKTYTGSAIKPAPTVKDESKTLKLNTDYTLSYKNNVNAGTATVTVTFKGNYSGSKSVNFKITAKKLTKPSISAISDKTYTSGAIKPTPTVKDGDKTLKLNTDYTLTYKNNINVGTATVTVTFKGNYTGSKSVSFKIIPMDIKYISYSSIPDQKYTGKPITPALTVQWGTYTLKRGTDYTYNPGANTEKGTAIIMLFGHGNFTGSKSVFFKIV